MPPKYKVTGCARFFFFLIIFIPAIFFGAAFLRGENGVQIIKDFYHNIVEGGDKAGSKTEEKTEAQDTYKVEDLKEELQKAEDEIASLKKEIEAKDKQIEKLKSGEK
jgi:predicted RNase H-like nuclease (RuvC/YqgF family)